VTDSVAPLTSVAAAAGPTGRLMHVLSTRSVQAPGASTMVIQHREALVYTLGKAAQLEQLVMCQYLYAAFSMKERDDEGLSDDQLTAVRRWRRELMHIAEQEMLHLALVQNLLSAVGAAPAFGRPNFPLPPHAYPAGIRMALLPFGETALRHFIYLERPEGLEVDDDEAFAALDKAAPLPAAEEDEIGPRVQEFATIGALYRAVELGLESLVTKLGEGRLFLGPRAAQATPDDFQLDEVRPVTDLASAHAAVDTIVEQGEGARGAWRNAHFGRLVAIFDEFEDLRDADPSFEPARPVLAAIVREREDGLAVPLITDHFTNRVADLLNAVYEVLLQVLSRYFAHTTESADQLAILADVAVGLMKLAIKPLGGLVTRLPVGAEHPGRSAGPSFELFFDVDYLLPHRDAAWLVMEERLRDVAELAMRCREACIPIYFTTLTSVTNALRAQADQLAAGREAAG
jgi:Ferritin-like